MLTCEVPAAWFALYFNAFLTFGLSVKLLLFCRMGRHSTLDRWVVSLSAVGGIFFSHLATQTVPPSTIIAATNIAITT